MNRRSFLGRLLTGAAAVVGAGALAPSAVRAEASGQIYSPEYDHEVIGESVVTLGSPAYVQRFSNPDKNIEINLLESNDVIKSWPGWNSNTLIVYPPTFEAMAQDCAVRGCSLEGVRLTTLAMMVHRSLERGNDRVTFKSPDDSVVYARVDAWRRSLHETG